MVGHHCVMATMALPVSMSVCCRSSPSLSPSSSSLSSRESDGFACEKPLLPARSLHSAAARKRRRGPVVATSTVPRTSSLPTTHSLRTSSLPSSSFATADPVAPAATGAATVTDANERGDTDTATVLTQIDSTRVRWTRKVTDWRPYSPLDNARYYQARPFAVAGRLLQIGGAFGGWFLSRWWDEFRGVGADQRFKLNAGRLREVLTALGPAYVKIGQAVASRPDVFPPAYLAELTLLQDRLPAFPTRDALALMKEEFGIPVSDIFAELTPEPIAAASLGQVYRGYLRATGTKVAVKVQRPGVQRAISLDVYIIRVLAGYAAKLRRLNSDLQAIVDEWATSLYQELDYEQEAQNGIRFRELYGDLPDVFVPLMFTDYTTTRVLTMQWVDGQRLDKGDNTPESKLRDLHLVEVGVYCSLSQLLDVGFYHADPHEGNILRTKDDQLAYIDFGMMGDVDLPIRNALVKATVHLVNKEYAALARDFVTLGLLPADVDLNEVAPALTDVFRKATERGVRNISFSDLSGDLGATMFRYRFRIPPYYSLIIRSLTVLEGIALSKDPNYKVLSAAYPWIARRLLTDKSQDLRDTLKEILYTDGGRFRMDRLDSLLSEANRPMFTTPSMSSAAPSDDKRGRFATALRFALSEEGDFVLESVLDELTKGIDALNRAALDGIADTLAKSLPSFLSTQTTPALSRVRSLYTQEDKQHLEDLQQFVAFFQRSMRSERPTMPTTMTASTYRNSMTTSTTTTAQPQMANGSTVQFSSPFQQATFYLREAVNVAQGLNTKDIQDVLELPDEVKLQAVRVPFRLAEKLLSRTVARALRDMLPPPDEKSSAFKMRGRRSTTPPL
eukprot:jgi/Chlat1/6196/Chrsp44S05808